jgi:hypothetical protein
VTCSWDQRSRYRARDRVRKRRDRDHWTAVIALVSGHRARQTGSLLVFAIPKTWKCVAITLPTLFDRQCQRLLRHAAQSVGDLEGKIGVPHRDRGSGDFAGCGVE